MPEIVCNWYLTFSTMSPDVRFVISLVKWFCVCRQSSYIYEEDQVWSKKYLPFCIVCVCMCVCVCVCVCVHGTNRGVCEPLPCM